MSFDYWKQYKSEMDRLKEKANPIHADHIDEFNMLCHQAIAAEVPDIVKHAIDDYNKRLCVAFETYLNGDPIYHKDIVKGVSGALQKAIREAGQSIVIRF